MNPMTFTQVSSLKKGQVIFHRFNKNKKGKPEEWKVDDIIQTNTSDTLKVQIRLKRGLHTFCHLTEKNLWYFSLNNQ